MFNLLPAINLASFGLLLAVILLYQRQDNKYSGCIYGWAAGAVVLLLFSVARFLTTLLYSKFSDFTVLTFWAATLLFAILNFKEEKKWPGLLFFFFGLLLGLSPLNFVWLKLFSATVLQVDAGYAYLFSFIYLFIWLILTLKKRYFSLPMFSFSLTVANLPFVYKQLFMFVLNLIHELFHLYSIVLLLPDHPYLNMWLYLFIKTVLDTSFSATLTVLLLLLPVLIFLWQQRQSWLRQSWLAGPKQRKAKAYQMALWRWQVFLVLVWILIAGGAATASLVKKPDNPIPKEVVIDGQNVLITETNPFTRLEAGKISKYLLTWQQHKYRLLVLKEESGRYKAALDACAICGWEKGYSQLKNGDLVCNVCGTTLPLNSLGQGGGCNPVPLKVSKQMQSGLVIKLKEIEKAAKNVKGNLN